MSNEQTGGVLQGHASCGECGSRDNRGVYKAKEGTYNSTCFGCKDYKDHGGECPDLVKGSEACDPGGFSHVFKYPYLRHSDRNIPKEVAEFYGVRSEVKGATEVARYYPYHGEEGLSGYKVRALPKKFHAIGTISGNIKLFGQQLFKGGKMVVITAGEDDAIASYWMTKWVRGQEEWRTEDGKNVKGRAGTAGIPSVSLPRGANDLKSIKDNLEWLESFDVVVFAVDQEDLDIQAAKKAIQLLTPGKGKIARFSLKDASEMCKAKKPKEYYNALFEAIEQKPSGIIEGDGIWAEWQKKDDYTTIPFPEHWGLGWSPGLYYPSLVAVTAGTGVGKSSVLRELQLHIFNTTTHNIGVITMEDPIYMCTGVLMGMHLGKRIMTPDIETSEDEIKTAHNALFNKGRFVFCENKGIRSSDDLVAKIRFMALSRDCKVIFLDHLTALVNKFDSSGKGGKNDYVEHLVNTLNDLVQELDIALVLVSHVRKTGQGEGKTYETGAVPTEDAMFGSSAIKQYSYLTLAMSRDKSQEDSPTHIHILKDRLVGRTGKSNPLMFDFKTGRYEGFNPEVKEGEAF